MVGQRATLTELRHFEEALEVCYKLLKTDPKSYQAWFNQGIILKNF